jgi:hypothetical protein
MWISDRVHALKRSFSQKEVRQGEAQGERASVIGGYGTDRYCWALCNADLQKDLFSVVSSRRPSNVDSVKRDSLWRSKKRGALASGRAWHRIRRVEPARPPCHQIVTAADTLHISFFLPEPLLSHEFD